MLLLVAAIVASCSSRLDHHYTPSTAHSQASASQKEDELTFAFPTDQSEIMTDTLKQFNSRSSNSQVKAMPIPSERYNQTLNMLMTSGIGPDVFYLNPEWLRTYIEKNWLREITDQTMLKRYPDWAVQYGADNHKSYTVFSRVSVLRLLYNKDLFEWAGLQKDKPPVTLQDMARYASQISARGAGFKKYGFALPAAEEWEGYTRSIEILSGYSGVELQNPTTNVIDFRVLQPWLETYLQLKKNHGLFPGEASMKQSTALSLFKEGSVGMILATNSEINTLLESPEINFDWSIALPVKKSQDTVFTEYAVPDGLYVINSRASNQELAGRLWNYLHSFEVENDMLLHHHIIPTASDVIAKEADRGQPIFSLYNYPMSELKVQSRINSIIDEYTSDYISTGGRIQAYQDMMDEKQPIQAILEEMNRAVNKK